MLFLFNVKTSKLKLNTNFLASVFNYSINGLVWDSKYLVTITDSKGLPLTRDNVPYIPITFFPYYFDWVLYNKGEDVDWLIDNLYWIIDWFLVWSNEEKKFQKNEFDIDDFDILKQILEDRICYSDMIKNVGGESNYIYVSIVFTKINN